MTAQTIEEMWDIPAADLAKLDLPPDTVRACKAMFFLGARAGLMAVFSHLPDDADLSGTVLDASEAVLDEILAFEAIAGVRLQ